MDNTNAPFAIGCTNCAKEILFFGKNTMDGIPAAAAYADKAADVAGLVDRVRRDEDVEPDARAERDDRLDVRRAE